MESSNKPVSAGVRFGGSRVRAARGPRVRDKKRDDGVLGPDRIERVVAKE